MLRRMFLTLLTLLSASVVAAESLPYTAQPCDLPVVSAPVAARLQCGLLRVQSADGSPFQLAVVRKAAAAPIAGAAPVLYLQGGVDSAISHLLEPTDLVAGHELIAVDLRGTGRSNPQFCPQLAQTLLQSLQQSPDDVSLQQSRRDALLQCQQQMQQQGYNAADFGTVQTVQDLELLRTQLQIEKWHLYSRSDGTVVALHYLAVAPQAVQSMTLDSVYPPDELLTSFKLQQDQWLRQLDQLCQQQRGCKERFGALPALFNRALARVSQTPLQIGVAPQTLWLTGEKLRLAVMAAASTETTLSLLPLWLDAVATGQPALLGRWAELLIAQARRPFAATMATECADRRRFYQPGRADSLEQLFGLPDGICPAFGLTAETLQSPQVPATAKVRTPVLLLAGGLDLFQPDSLVLTQWLGPHSQLVAVPAALHGVHGPDTCLHKMVSDFIRAPQRFGPPACLAQLAKPYLVTDVEPQAQVASEFALLSRGQPSVALWMLAASLGLAAVLGLIWPLAAGSWHWFTGAAVPVHKSAVLSAVLVCVTLMGWGGLVLVLWQSVTRQSAELWLGLPVDSQPWRLGIVMLALPALGMIWWLARQQQWRQLLAQQALLAATLTALWLQLLP